MDLLMKDTDLIHPLSGHFDSFYQIVQSSDNQMNQSLMIQRYRYISGFTHYHPVVIQWFISFLWWTSEALVSQSHDTGVGAFRCSRVYLLLQISCINIVSVGRVCVCVYSIKLLYHFDGGSGGPPSKTHYELSLLHRVWLLINGVKQRLQ